MTKFIALVAAGAFAAGTMFAGEHGDCAKKAGNEGKMACTASLATLNLLLRSSLQSSKRSAARKKRQGPKHVASETAVAAVTI
jgi:hypothetical protein